MPDDINPQVREALDERIDWINQVTDLCRKRGPEGIQKPIADIDDEHLRSMIFVLILGRAGDQDQYAAMLARLN
jgi:hypothetical protein